MRYSGRIVQQICISVGHKHHSTPLGADQRYRYDEVRAPYVEQLAFTWMEDSKTDIIRAGVDKKIDRFVKGDLAHATETLSALWEIANKEGDIEAPSSPTSTVSSSRFHLLR